MHNKVVVPALSLRHRIINAKNVSKDVRRGLPCDLKPHYICLYLCPETAASNTCQKWKPEPELNDTMDLTLLSCTGPSSLSLLLCLCFLCFFFFECLSASFLVFLCFDFLLFLALWLSVSLSLLLSFLMGLY